MAEAKRKTSNTKRFLAEHPLCCYCGGHEAATTVDHVPSRQMFFGRDRPPGLEVPACKPCNKATKNDEQVAALLARSYPDSTTPEQLEELRRILMGTDNNVHGVLEEMVPSFRQEKKARRLANSQDVGALNVGGPLLNRSMTAFSVKLAFALHYACTGKIIPHGGGVMVRWFSNVEKVEGKIPAQFLSLFTDPRTLKQGRKSAADQFIYDRAISSDSEYAAYCAAFRQSFLVAAVVRSDASAFDANNGAPIYRPGIFRSGRFEPCASADATSR